MDPRPPSRSTPRRSTFMVLLLPGLAIACSDALAPPAEAPGEAAEVASVPETAGQRHAAATFSFQMLDRCEPASFNAVLGAGTCVGNGKVTFQEFIDELVKKQTHNQWRNQPKQVSLAAGRELSVVNVGGEAHTFTPVAAFGGGFIPDLNALSGNPVPAPECLDFSSIVFVPAGGVASLGTLSAGTHRFMCCLHPWMRTTADVH